MASSVKSASAQHSKKNVDALRNANSFHRHGLSYDARKVETPSTYSAQLNSSSIVPQSDSRIAGADAYQLAEIAEKPKSAGVSHRRR